MGSAGSAWRGWRRIAAVTSVAAAAALLTLAHGRLLEGQAVEAASARLLAQAALTVRAAVAWREESALDVQVLAASAALRATDGATQGRWLTEVAGLRGWREAWLVDPAGRVVASAGARPDRTARDVDGALARARGTDQVVVSRLFLDEGTAVFDLAVRVGGGPSVLVARLPASRLARAIQGPGGDGASGESVLVQREGDDAVFATPLRFSPAPPLTLRRPLADRALVSARAASGELGTLRGLDYRGVPVLAAAQLVPGLPWTLLATVDLAEVVAPARRTALLEGLALSTLLALAWLGLAWKRRRRARARLAAAALDAERAELASLLTQLDEAVVATDADFRIRAWNGAAERIYGWKAEQAVGRPLHELLRAEYPPGSTFEARVEQLRRLGSVQLTSRHRRQDGTPLDVEVRVACVRGPDGAVTGYVGAHRDVSSALRAREELARREALLQLVASHVPAGVFLADAGGRTAWINEGMALLTGLPLDSLMERGWLQAVHPGDLPVLEQALLRARSGTEDRVAFDLRFARPDGDERRCHVVTLALGEGASADWIGVVVDLTEERRLAERAARAERLAGLGALAGGMAHRVNNPLAAVLGSIRFALSELAAAGEPRLLEAAEALREAEEDGRRIAAIVKDLESFAAPSGAGGLHDLREVLQEALRLASPDLTARAMLEVDLGPVPLVHGERADLRQLALHLLTRAWRAIPEGRPGGHQVRVHTRTGEDGGAELEVRDDGRALTEEERRLAFEPFPGRRGDAPDPWLALVVCHGIATSLGGSVDLTSVPGHGTAVLVWLPAAPPAPAPSLAPAPDALSTIA